MRPLSLDDVDLAIELFTDPEVSRHVGGTLSVKQIRLEMPRWVRRANDGSIGIWVVELKDTGERCGTAALLPLPVETDDTEWELLGEGREVDAEIELGYILKKAAWGRGIATEAAMCILEFGFTEGALEEIVAVIDDENHASRHVLGKLGFVDTGPRKAYAEICPGFRLTCNQWRSRNGASA